MKNTKYCVVAITFLSFLCIHSAFANFDGGPGMYGPPLYGSGMYGSGIRMGPPEGDFRDGRSQMKDNREEMRNNRNDFRSEDGNFQYYLRTDLTSTERETVKSLFDAHKKFMDSTMEREKVLMMSGSVTDTGALIASIETQMDTLAASLAPYIDPDKSDAFKKFLADRLDMIRKNLSLRMDNRNIRAQYRDDNWEGDKNRGSASNDRPKPVLSEKIRKQFSEKLDSIPDDRKSILFTAIIAKIDSLLTQVKNDKVKAQLSELRAIVQDKLDALSGDASESSIIDQILDVSASGSVQP